MRCLFNRVIFAAILFCFFITGANSTFYGQKKDTLALISFNDFHGAFVADDGIPGAASLVQEVMDIKKKHKYNVTVSAGDSFSGSYFSRITLGEPLPYMFNVMEVEMSAIGNHEFDWGQDFLKKSAGYTNYIAANITSNGLDFPNWLKPYRIVTKTIGEGKNGKTDIRIAFIGLSTIETARKTSPENIDGLIFTDPMAAACIQTLYSLKKEGKLDMIVIIAHIGTNMIMPTVFDEVNSYFIPYIDGIDAIISGHSHEVVLSSINDVPIIQAGSSGSHVGKLLFEIERIKDKKNNRGLKIKYIGGDTLIVDAQPDKNIEKVVGEYVDKYDFDMPLAFATEKLLHDRTVNKFDFTAVGAYITDSYANSFRYWAVLSNFNNIPVIGVNHYGGIRSSIPQGTVTKLRAGNVLPFGGILQAYMFTGARLKQLLTEGRNNKNGFLQSSNIQYDIYKDSISNIKINGVLISNEGECIVVLDSFITTGGDGYSASLFEGYKIESFCNLSMETTSVFIDYLNKLKDKNLSEAKAPMPVVRKVD